MALKNGIKCYSIVPFVRSEKNQLIEVLLNHEIIDLLNIDRTDLRNNLEKCFEKVWDNKMIEICNYYTHHPDLPSK